MAQTVCGTCSPCRGGGDGDHRGDVRVRGRRIRPCRAAPPCRADRYPAAAKVGPSRPAARHRGVHWRLRQRARRGRCTGLLLAGHRGRTTPAHSLQVRRPCLRPRGRPRSPSVEAQLGTGSFRMQAERVGDDWVVAAQSLASTDRIESDLVLLEAIAGPILLVAVFLGTLLIGVKAASPVELARRRQLEFTADASHELRTPLSVIEAEVTLSLTGSRSNEDYRATLGRVNQESWRLRDIVEDLLWLARFDSEPLPPADEPVDVAAIATACCDRFLAVAHRSGIALSVRDEGTARPWIKAPPEWIDRLTAVLVDNACRYAGSGGTVRIEVTVSGSRVSLMVDDSGPGIAPEDRSKLFHRFHRATDQGNGAGLGLAIADSVVRATGGEWSVGQADLGGAHMEVSWRRSPGGRGPDEARQPPEPSISARTPKTTISAG